MILYSTPSELITYVYDFSISMTHRQRRARIYFKQSLLGAANNEESPQTSSASGGDSAAWKIIYFLNNSCKYNVIMCAWDALLNITSYDDFVFNSFGVDNLFKRFSY